MNDEQLLRYSRQIMLPSIDIEGQQALLDARVLIIGMGGLGSPVGLYLAAAGIGHMVISDFDEVDLSNLQRQIAHTTKHIGQPKVESAKQSFHQINPMIEITAINKKLEGDELLAQVKLADIVVDCCDNFETRFAINDACVAAKTPLVSGAAIRFEGQISVFDSRDNTCPCYNCLYPRDGAVDQSCSDNGVIAPITGIIGSMQALEAIKVLTGAGKSLQGRVLLLDGLSMDWQSMKLPRNPNCPTCSNTTTE
ncbi:HesA/MoeB/ThiF family protein [Cycloclasticus pugetii]|uniref:Molybdopterin-synthase adenylyltransferase n=2 Tax=Cycloclasticus zancles TaxID=1329899 RepID=S5T9S9_9GAMM|nr:molybdopterin-synthase adenylyltransferase MoeB [Cycloclasticus pugetii]AGS40491.1 Dinucleotide-utilizing enzymes involved in molybdopterin and thiamine biosynthesis family 2 [Cycloclasticus zancles 78-ME]MDF1830019.1 molybdopterin-synthase adenylyltransferase MoeB [Cycloclasticus pugetii]